MSTKPADPTQLGVVQAAAAALRVGDRIRLTPGSDGKRAWTVRARSRRFIVATCIEGFGRGIAYTCIDTTGWLDWHYNGQGRGVVRSSLDTLGGGWDIGPDGEGLRRRLARTPIRQVGAFAPPRHRRARN